MKRSVRIRIAQVTPGPGAQAAVRAYCPACGRDVDAIPAAQAARLLEIALPALARLTAEGTVHLLPMVSGAARICCDSVFVGKRPGGRR